MAANEKGSQASPVLLLTAPGEARNRSASWERPRTISDSFERP